MALAATAPQSASLSTLVDAVDRVVAEGCDGRGLATLSSELQEIRCQIDRLEGAFAERLSRFERLEGHVAEGAVSVVAWLRHRCRLSMQGAAVRARVARSLPVISGAPDAFQRGEMGLGHAAAMAQLVERVGADAAAKVGELMVDVAKRMEPERFRVVARHLRHAVDAGGALADARRQHDKRILHLTATLDGMFAVNGELDAEGGALLRAALEPLSRPLPHDERNAGARRADALVELARRQLAVAGALPAVNGERPHLVVTTTLATLAGVGPAPAGELPMGGTVPSEAVRRIACDAAVTVVPADAGAHPGDVGRKSRRIPLPLRRALVARDGGCRFPSCDRPPEWTDAHHIVHWIDGGKTNLRNLVLLCRFHHRFAHEGGWRIGFRDDGSILGCPP